MQLACELHPLGPKDGGDLDHGLDVVGAVEEGEPLTQDREEDHARAPDVDLGGLFSALEEYFWCAEATGSRAVGAPRGPRVDFRVPRLRPRLDRGVGYGVLEAVFADLSVLVAETGLALCAFALGEAEVYEDPALLVRVVEEVGGLDVAVDNPLGVHRRERREEGFQVDAGVVDVHLGVVFAEVLVAEVGEDDEDLVGFAECRD